MGCGPRAVAVTLIDDISGFRIGVRTLDAVELVKQPVVRATEGLKVGCCPRVRLVKFLVGAEPCVGCIELGKPSDETRRGVVEGSDIRCALGWSPSRSRPPLPT